MWGVEKWEREAELWSKDISILSVNYHRSPEQAIKKD
jgi:hypothetical protein